MRKYTNKAVFWVRVPAIPTVNRGLRGVFLAGVLAAMPNLVARAQTAPAPAAAQTPPPPAAAPKPAAGNPAGEAKAAPPQAQMLSQRFDDWIWRCAVPADGKTPPSCEIAQSIKVNQNGNLIDILNLAVSRADDKAGKVEWALVALTPFDVHLPSDFGLTLGADDPKTKVKAKPIVTRYRNCNQLGCFVVTPLDAATIDRLKHVQEGAGFFRLLNGKTVKVVFSLKGFDKALDGLASKALPPAAVAAASPPPSGVQPNTAPQPQPATQPK